jgi:hypothetical protein
MKRTSTLLNFFKIHSEMTNFIAYKKFKITITNYYWYKILNCGEMTFLISGKKFKITTTKLLLIKY